jgi:hypothetical protein
MIAVVIKILNFLINDDKYLPMTYRNTLVCHIIVSSVCGSMGDCAYCVNFVVAISRA